jgi:hypothetical protein
MIKTFEDLSETSFSQSICYFKSIGNMTSHFSYIFIFIIVKTPLGVLVGGQLKPVAPEAAVPWALDEAAAFDAITQGQLLSI